MFRAMRRFKQLLPEAENIAVLERAHSGVLALLGDGGYPYAVPMSFAYAGGKLLFHTARAGHKVDALKNEPKASFCVVDMDEVVPEKFTTQYRSVIAFGKARLVEDPEQKRSAMRLIAGKYSPGHMERGKEDIEKQLNNFLIIELEIEHISGKEAMALVNARAARQG